MTLKTYKEFEEISAEMDLIYKFLIKSLSEENGEKLDRLMTIYQLILNHNGNTFNKICNELKKLGCQEAIISFSGKTKEGAIYERKPPIVISLLNEEDDKEDLTKN